MEKLLKLGSIILLPLALFVGLLFFKIESLIPDADSVLHIITHIRIDITTHIHTDITTLTTIPMALIGGNRWVSNRHPILLPAGEREGEGIDLRHIFDNADSVS